MTVVSISALVLGRMVFCNGLTKLATEVVSAFAAGYAAAFRDSAFRRDGDLVIASGLPQRAYPRGGVCVGRVFLTGPRPSRAVIAHEKRHVTQWYRYGALFPLLYAVAGRDAFSNRFEIEAGLEDGGYLPVQRPR